MDSKFDHTKIEKSIYEMWEKSGAFKPKKSEHANTRTREQEKPFTILMPPPNANASLHAGHGMYTIDDILTRWKRMQGYSAMWVPGRDHAGFETQFVYEKHLKKEGKSRLDFDRETLYKNVAKFVEDNSGLIYEQFRRLGFSADWSRSVFTLDPHVVERVFATFKKMNEEELVYRSDYLVNYCPHCGTSLADLEVKHTDKVDSLYYIKYPLVGKHANTQTREQKFIVVATVRPETMFGDTAVAVHPEDKRYKNLIGTELELPLTSRKIPVIADPVVDMEFGTGAVKITPAHDPNDFETGKRHELEVIRVINQMGRMEIPEDATPQELMGKTVYTAREMTVELLKQGEFIEKINDKYEHAVTTCYKCGRNMEPLTVPNWYIKVDPLKPAVVEAVKSGKTKIYPKNFKKQLLDWMEIMHDWPISRQIAWGIRIPAWYEIRNQESGDSEQSNERIHVTFLDKSGKQVNGQVGELLKTYKFEEIEKGLQTLTAPSGAKYVIAKDKPGENYLQETDTFDTWFSSGQWPLVTLKDDEYETRYPTDVMATMSDILKAWVSRMMMFGLYIKGDVPFRDVYLWSKVTDGKGQKMSKSKGNVINPIELVDKYGADAFRMSLLFGNGEGGNIPLSDDKVRAMRNFSNKLWNMARFYLLMEDKNRNQESNLRQGFGGQAGDSEKSRTWFRDIENDKLKDEDIKIIGQLNEIIESVTKSMEKYRFAEAADVIYHFMWHTVADSYIERVKDRDDKEVALPVLLHVLHNGLKLLHPFMPFVTEAIWQELPRKKSGNLITSSWPTFTSASSV